MITQPQLSGFLGKSIAHLCPNGDVSPMHTHGAHFVAHLLGYAFGATCYLRGTHHGPPATIRVQDLFSRCSKLGVWSLRPATMSACLVFISRASNVNLAGRTMGNMPRTHVGLFVGGHVWHYSNSQHAVVKQTPAQFSLHYPAPDNAMFYGLLRW